MQAVVFISKHLRLHKGGGAEAPLAPQNDLRSLLKRSKTSKPRKTITMSLPTSPSPEF